MSESKPGMREGEAPPDARLPPIDYRTPQRARISRPADDWLIGLGTTSGLLAMVIGFVLMGRFMVEAIVKLASALRGKKGSGAPPHGETARDRPDLVDWYGEILRHPGPPGDAGDRSAQSQH